MYFCQDSCILGVFLKCWYIYTTYILEFQSWLLTLKTTVDKTISNLKCSYFGHLQVYYFNFDCHYIQNVHYYFHTVYSWSASFHTLSETLHLGSWPASQIAIVGSDCSLVIGQPLSASIGFLMCSNNCCSNGNNCITSVVPIWAKPVGWWARYTAIGDVDALRSPRLCRNSVFCERSGLPLLQTLVFVTLQTHSRKGKPEKHNMRTLNICSVTCDKTRDKIESMVTSANST